MEGQEILSPLVPPSVNEGHQDFLENAARNIDDGERDNFSNNVDHIAQSRADRAAQKRAVFLSSKKVGIINEQEDGQSDSNNYHPMALRTERYTELPMNALSRQTLIFSETETEKPDPSAGNIS